MQLNNNIGKNEPKGLQACWQACLEVLFIIWRKIMSGFFGLMSAAIPYDWALLLVRLGISLGMLPWGLKKVETYKTFGAKHEPPKIFAVGPLSAKTGFLCVMLIEFLTPICLILGFFTRLAVIPGIFSFGVAVRDTKGPYFTSPAMPYFLMLIVFLIIGPGQYSLDYLFSL